MRQRATTRPASLARVFLYLHVFTALTGCDQPAQPAAAARSPQAGATFVLIGPAEHHPQWAAVVGGARRALRGLPHLDLRVAAAARTGTPAEPDWRARIDAELRDPPVALCVFDPEATLAPAELARLERSGGIVVYVGSRRAPRDYFAQVLINWPGAAETLGAALPQLLGERRTYVLAHERSSGPDAAQRYERFMPAARRAFELHLLDEVDLATPDGPARERVQALFARFPSAALVVTLSPDAWLLNRTTEPLETGRVFATLGAPPALWSRLGRDAAALVGPLDGELGAAAIELASRGLSVDHERGVVRWIDCELVTPPTLRSFAERYARSAGLRVSDLVPAGTLEAVKP
ncbi:MAG: hypothetical protein AB7Q17_05085 [Phycisphaerae bacterium]